MTGAPPKLAFDSYAELAEVLRAVSARLHHVNRVAAGESGFVWHYAEVLAACAALAPLCQDSDLKAEFGDGWTPGSLPRADRTDRMIELLRDRLRT